MRQIDADELIKNTVLNPLHPPYVTKKDIEDAPTVGGWVSVEDRLPEKDGKYLVYVGDTPRGYCKLATFTNAKTKENSYLEPGYGWSDYDSDYGYYEVRHVAYWTSLPEPPKEVKPGAV